MSLQTSIAGSFPTTDRCCDPPLKEWSLEMLGILIMIVFIAFLAWRRYGKRTPARPDKFGPPLVSTIPPPGAMLDARIDLVLPKGEVSLLAGRTPIVYGSPQPESLRFVADAVPSVGEGRFYVTFTCRLQGAWRLVEFEVVSTLR